MTTRWVCVDGALVDGAAPALSAFDHAVMTGDGVFETFRVVEGVPFALRRHLARLERSAGGMGLPLPPAEYLSSAISKVIQANGLIDGRLRVTVTGGPSDLGSERAAVPATVIVSGAPMRPWPGVADVSVVPWPRNERGALAGLKTVSYGENVVALAYAKQRGSSEAIFANLAGNLCEGTGTNVFVGIGGRLITPPLSAGCLAGVTRQLLIELVPVSEQDVTISALAEAEEAFLTSSTRDVQPIRAVDGKLLPAAPGPLTTAAADAFAKLVATDLDP